MFLERRQTIQRGITGNCALKQTRVKDVAVTADCKEVGLYSAWNERKFGLKWAAGGTFQHDLRAPDKWSSGRAG
jgi:hypothetical protein